MKSLLPIQQALISVFNKSKILNFTRSLSQHNIRLLSTNGTAQILSKHNLIVHKISDYTQLPEIMSGRIKTLHHKIYAGILNRPGIDDHIIKKNQIRPIDMIVINFYPFYEILQSKQYSPEEILKYIDIGGPSMVRAAVKNYKNKVIIVDIQDYDNILNELEQYKGSISLNTRYILASKALKYIIKYDTDISNYFNSILKIDKNKHNHTPEKYSFPDTLKFMHLQFKKKQNIRYGENPHQKAVLYEEITETLQQTKSAVNAQQLQGKPLSYNNIIDIDTALECVKIFSQPTCVIVKHANPCGVATSHSISDAYIKAYQSDPISAFGGIIALNRTLTDIAVTQTIISQHFVEAIIAPAFSLNCLKILANKKNIRILSTGSWKIQESLEINLKSITGGLLIQTKDTLLYPQHLEIVTICQPTTQEIQDSLFCWKIVKFVKSNAIVCAKHLQTTGIGSGQTNRINAVKIATTPTIPFYKGQPLGSSMASDAFFPFADGIHAAANMGIRCILQPGGSIKDLEVIKAANQHKISMIFTHTRHFRH